VTVVVDKWAWPCNYSFFFALFFSFSVIRTQEKAKKIFKDLTLESAQYNMQINAKKTKTMVVTRNEGIQAKLEYEGIWIK